MNFTPSQRCEILKEIVQQKEGINFLLQFAIESMMKQEHELYRTSHPEGYSNGFRYRKTYGRGEILELRVPRTRFGRFLSISIKRIA